MTIRKASIAGFESAARTDTPADITAEFPGTQQSVPKSENLANAHIVVDVTAVSGTAPGVTPKVFYVDPLSGKEIDLISGIAEITAVSTVVLKVGRDIESAAGLAKQDIIPADLKVRMVHTNAVDSLTYSVSVLGEFDCYQ